MLPRGRGCGYAAEAAAGLAHHARDTLGFARVVGIVKPRNQKSIRVLERAGLRLVEGEHGPDGLRVWEL
jgi:RimJ/RimL family protein N-acetyltransferase